MRTRWLVAALLPCALAALGFSLQCSPVGPYPLHFETITIPSQAAPPNTPGTAGVVVSSPKLISQFSTAAIDLNTATYTRWRQNGLEQQPDAILVAVAGFGGGANNFKSFIEELIPQVQNDHGLVLEVWGFHRRSNQLEDRKGFHVAEFFGSPITALDWYYGTELGLSLDPLLAFIGGRRAIFYNTSDDIPFLASWSSQVHTLDIDAVIEEARTVVKNDNVFLAGHSAGTGFAARYASTDFDLSGAGPPQPGYAKLRGLVLMEGGGGSTASGPGISDDSLDRMIAKADGGLFGAVRDAAPRCVDGTTPCTVATEAVDCAAFSPPVCTPDTSAYSSLIGGPGLLAASEVLALQAQTVEDPDAVLALVQEDQGAPGNNAVAVVPDLGLLGILPNATPYNLFGTFLDDDGIVATLLSPAVATALGEPGPTVDGLATWKTLAEGPFSAGVVPDNGPPPTTLSGTLRWGQEVEVAEMARLVTTFTAAGTNAADWYYPTSGLSITSASGVCDVGVTGLCIAGDVGAACAADGDCNQSISLDSSRLSLDPPAGRGRRDIANLTQAGAIDIPVIAIGGSNGLAPVPGVYVPFASSIGPCTAPSCDGTPRVVDPSLPNEAFPTFGGVNGGFEVHISEGYAHNDVLAAENEPGNQVIGPVSDFLARNVQ